MTNENITTVFLAWSGVVLAFENSKRISEEVKNPKALGDIRGVLYKIRKDLSSSHPFSTYEQIIHQIL